MDTTGKRITELRKQVGLSQDELAEKANVSRQTVYRWESDNRTPDGENIKSLCKILGTDAEYILHGCAALTAAKERRGVLWLIAAIAISVAAVFLIIFAVAVCCIYFQPASGIEDVTISEFHNWQGTVILAVLIVAAVTAVATSVYLVIRYIKRKKRGM